MSFLDIMHSYFQGEKLEAWFFILPVGLLLIGFGVVALKAEEGGFAWGIAIPCFVFGVILAATGIGVGSRTNNQVAELEAAYQADPVAMQATELPRMKKVNANFRLTYWVFGAIALLGLVIHYLGGMQFGRGFGLMLLLGGAIGLLIDGFAERRAEPYTQALQEITSTSTSPGTDPQPSLEQRT